MSRTHRMPAWRLLAMVLVLSFVFSAVAAAKVSIIVAKGSTYKPTEAEIKSYFTGVKLSWPDGTKVQVVDQPDAVVAKTFYEKFIGSTIATVRKEWTKLILSGQAVAPVKCGNDAEVKKAVSGNPAAIGYIDGATLDDSVREVAKVE